MTDTIANQKPRKVTAAIYLILLSYLIAIVYAAFHQMTRKFAPATFFPESGALMNSILIFVVVFMLFYIFVVFKMSVGKKWARTLFLIFTALAFAGNASEFFQNDRIYKNTTSLVETLLQVIALVLLFSKEANEWYNLKKDKSNQESAPNEITTN